MIYVKVEQNEKELLKASANYLKDLECYEVEIIKNDLPADTLYRIEMIDGKSLDITKEEFRGLKALLNNHSVSYLLGLE